MNQSRVINNPNSNNSEVFVNNNSKVLNSEEKKVIEELNLICEDLRKEK